MTDDEKAALADVYERAAEYLEKYGWCQGQTAKGKMGRKNPSCFAVAMYEGTTAGVYHRALEFAASALELNMDDACGAIFNWNDDPDRTVDEVINTLHALANKLR